MSELKDCDQDSKKV